MVSNFDRERVVDCMFDPVTSSILAELEQGRQECSSLAKKSSITENEVLERMSYLLEHGFVLQTIENGKSFLSANTEKLNSIVENSENFGATIEGLEKLDSYLN